MVRAICVRCSAKGRAAYGETDLIEGIRADLAEVEDIAGEEMRLREAASRFEAYDRGEMPALTWEEVEKRRASRWRCGS